MNSHFLLAAAHSGAGKTTVTLGLLRALQRKGYSVQPFKCGPDYIDPIHHRTAAGRDSINLDRFMMSDDHIRSLYDRYGSNAEIAITEGVMGLFDGARKREGSSADIAQLLKLPVILVLNAKAMAYSAAALLYGLKNFDTTLHVAGVIFNFVERETHYRLLCEACEDVGITPLGYLPANDGLRIPARHLGLDTADAETAISAAADHIEKHIDLQVLLNATRVDPQDASKAAPSSSSRVSPTAAAPPIASRMKAAPPATAAPSGRQILIARDEAFHFLYPENIRRLEEWGQVSYFSPIRDQHFPCEPDLLYLPGGYPELYLEALSSNATMLREINTYAAANGRIIAECGGMMYLGRNIGDVSGKTWPMAGVLDIATSMQPKKLTLGYRTVRLNGENMRGHEFHYSQLATTIADPSPGPPASATSAPTTAAPTPPAPCPPPANAEIFNARGEQVQTPVFYTPRLIAAYTHFYWGEELGLLKILLD